MNSDLILIPTYFRPEYLAVCLAHISQAEGGTSKRIWVGHDRHVKESKEQIALLSEVRAVLEQFEGVFRELRYIEQRPHSCIGNVLNILELYKEAFASDARFIYLIEDDVLITPDFFRWHEAIQSRGDYFCTVGWHCIRNPEVKPSNDPAAYIETSRDYSSIGVCWRREKLEAIVRHAQPAYYAHHARYLQQAFPNNPIPPTKWTEQAGVIMRVILSEPDQLLMAWPELARCAHVGINGYHRPRGYKFAGSLDQKVSQLSEASKATDRIGRLSKDPFDDIHGIPHVQEWTSDQLYVSQRFRWNGKL